MDQVEHVERVEHLQDRDHPLPRRAGRGYEVSKRGLDIAVATLALAVTSPLLATIAIAAAATQGRPILFLQERPGLGGRPFTIVKFRTMEPLAPGESRHGADARRVTRFGRFLRATSLDELPEFWNVLKGDMSLVGPRPLLMEYLDGYTAEEARRHEVRPGITGWAAVNGRHTTPFVERLLMDVWYVDNRSHLLDLRIVAMTVLQVLGRHDVSAVQHADEIQLPDRLRYPERAGSASPPGAAPHSAGGSAEDRATEDRAG